MLLLQKKSLTFDSSSFSTFLAFNKCNLFETENGKTNPKDLSFSRSSTCW